MNELIMAAIGCFALGLMTTLHPCPLTTNIAAISILSGVGTSRNRNFAVMPFFGLGYLIAFAGLALLINAGVIAIPRLSLFLQRVITGFLGPLLILTGMVLTGLISLKRFYRVINLDRNYWITKGSLFSTFVLGAVLALTFCPATASIFFGVMIPLSVKHEQPVLFPLLYAIGAIFPIIAISMLIYRGFRNVFQGAWIKRLPLFSGWIMIIIGIYIAIQQLYL